MVSDSQDAGTNRRRLDEHVGVNMPDGTEMFVRLPQITAENFSDSTELVVKELSESGSTNIIWTSMVINYATNFSANYLWGGINALQLITSTALFNVMIPDNSIIVFQYLKNMTKFDMFYDIYNPLEEWNLEFTETQPYNDNFEELGMESVCFFDVLGGMTVILVFTAVA